MNRLRADNSKQAADQDNALIDTPEHSDVDDDEVLADEGGPRPTGRFRRLQRRKSIEKVIGAALKRGGRSGTFASYRAASATRDALARCGSQAGVSVTRWRRRSPEVALSGDQPVGFEGGLAA